jgi:hypothetical protein
MRFLPLSMDEEAPVTLRTHKDLNASKASKQVKHAMACRNVLKNYMNVGRSVYMLKGSIFKAKAAKSFLVSHLITI